MTHDEIVALVENLAEAWNSRDLERLLSLLTDDVVWDDPAMEKPAAGRDAVSAFSLRVLRAFPDFHYEIVHPVCVAGDGSMCAVPWKITATNLGPLDPPGFAPTGRRVDFTGVDLLHLRDGRVSMITTVFNPLPAASQIMGLAVPPRPGSLNERLLVRLQRLRAWWLRRTRGGMH